MVSERKLIYFHHGFTRYFFSNNFLQLRFDLLFSRLESLFPVFAVAL